MCNSLPMPPRTRPENGIVYFPASLLPLFINPLPVPNRERLNKGSIGTRKKNSPCLAVMWGDGIRDDMSVVFKCDMAHTQLHWENPVPPTQNPTTCGKIFRWISHSSWWWSAHDSKLSRVFKRSWCLQNCGLCSGYRQEGSSSYLCLLMPPYLLIFLN